ncbi:MAG TPA: hypothetical protein VKV19_06600 [Ktedonobacteraceae bacterium]|nr:hypothetical protein [Ktedonobacteraceae bacterium]
MKTRRPPCLEWREKLALRHEDLSPEDQRALDAHVATCETCASALADYHFFEARLDALPPPAIKPLPRLSPHFFEQTERSRAPRVQQAGRGVHRLARELPALRQSNITFVGRLLSVAAVICLLLAASLVFRVVYQSRLAEHPGGITLFSLEQDSDAVMSVAWSPDGKYIAMASLDYQNYTVNVRDARSGNLICTYSGHHAEVYALAWSPDSRYIASGSGDGTVQVWDAQDCGAPIATYDETGPVMSVAWSPDGTEIASGGWGRAVHVWEVRSGQTLWTRAANDVVSSIAWAPNGDIAAGSYDEWVRVWDYEGHLLFNHDYQIEGNAAVNAVAWSPQKPYLLAVGLENGMVNVWNIFTPEPTDFPILNQPSSTDNYAIQAVAWSPNGKYLALGGNDTTVQVWNFSAGKKLMTYTGHTNTVSSLAWSPDGTEIVSGSFDTTVKVWKVVGL